MTDDELFVARMADLANLTDKSLITEAEIDRLIALARIGAAVQPHLHGDKPFCEECGLPIGWCNANALLKLADKKIERLEKVKP